MSPESGPQRQAGSLPDGQPKIMPLLPAGTMLWSGVTSEQIDFDSISHSGAVLLLASSMLANGAAIIVNGQVIDCVLVDQIGLYFGPQLARQLLELAGAGYSASEVGEDVAAQLPMLWRNTPISVGLDKRWIDVYGLMESVGEAGADRVVTVESGTSRGVVIFSSGRAATSYTSIDRRPTVAYQVVLPLFHDGKTGTVNIMEGSRSIPEASIAVSELARSLVPAGAVPLSGGWEVAPLPPQPALAQAPASQFKEPTPLFPSMEPGLPSLVPRHAVATVPESFPSSEPALDPAAVDEGGDWLANIADEKESWPELFDRSNAGATEVAPAAGGLLAKKMAQELSQQSPGNQVRFGFMVSQLLALSRQELGDASPVVEQVINSSEPTLEGLTTAIATVNALVPPGSTREQMANLVATMRMIVNDRFAKA